MRKVTRALKTSEAIAQWSEGRLDSTGMLRALISHKSWWVSVAPGNAAYLNTPGGQPRYALFFGDDDARQLFVFSDDFARDYFEAVMGSIALEGQFMQVPGSRLFQGNFSGADMLVINPCSEDTLTISKERFGTLNTLAGCIDIEQLLGGVIDGEIAEDDWTRLRRYANYRLAWTAQDDGDPDLVFDPSSQGRLVAAFTSDDCFRAFADEWVRMGHKAELKQATLRGFELFETLAANADDIDGVVFNCEGPARPIVLPVSFAREVIAA
jgi:hypothetical protein